MKTPDTRQATPAAACTARESLARLAAVAAALGTRPPGVVAGPDGTLQPANPAPALRAFLAAAVAALAGEVDALLSADLAARFAAAPTCARCGRLAVAGILALAPGVPGPVCELCALKSPSPEVPSWPRP